MKVCFLGLAYTTFEVHFLHLFKCGCNSETSKAFCGFLDQSKYQINSKVFQEGAFCREKDGQNMNDVDVDTRNVLPVRILNHLSSLMYIVNFYLSIFSSSHPSKPLFGGVLSFA